MHMVKCVATNPVCTAACLCAVHAACLGHRASNSQAYQEASELPMGARQHGLASASSADSYVAPALFRETVLWLHDGSMIGTSAVAQSIVPSCLLLWVCTWFHSVLQGAFVHQAEAHGNG